MCKKLEEVFEARFKKCPSGDDPLEPPTQVVRPPTAGLLVHHPPQVCNRSNFDLRSQSFFCHVSIRKQNVPYKLSVGIRLITWRRVHCCVTNEAMLCLSESFITFLFSLGIFVIRFYSFSLSGIRCQQIWSAESSVHGRPFSFDCRNKFDDSKTSPIIVGFRIWTPTILIRSWKTCQKWNCWSGFWCWRYRLRR